MSKSYKHYEESEELQTLAALADCTATKKQIQEVVDDINAHLSTTTGTLQNYNGKFKKAGLKALQENYQLFTNEEFYTAQKVAKVYNAIACKIIKGEKITIAPALLKMVIDYMKGEDFKKDVVDGVKYVTIGYEYAKEGNFTLPDSKILPPSNA
ncbi:MAG: hypothetical protein IJ730_02220 [Alphaproteobacteria bacterium]|nr:hypothetical protein [Alphaproteobacteria bacterium]